MMNCLCCGRNICKNASNPSEEPLIKTSHTAVIDTNPFRQAAAAEAKRAATAKPLSALEEIESLNSQIADAKQRGVSTKAYETAIENILERVQRKRAEEEATLGSKKSSRCCVM